MNRPTPAATTPCPQAELQVWLLETGETGEGSRVYRAYLEPDLALDDFAELADDIGASFSLEEHRAQGAPAERLHTSVSCDWVALRPVPLTTGQAPTASSDTPRTDRGRDASRALTEIRTVLSRAQTARQLLDRPTEYQLHTAPRDSRDIDFSLPQVEDPDADAMRDALDQAIELLSRWQRTGRATHSTPLA